MNAPEKFHVVELPNGESSDEWPFHVQSDIIVIEQTIEEKTTAGIILTGQEMKLPAGRVVAVGPGRIYTTPMDASGYSELGYFVPMTIKVGDYCVFGRFQSSEPIEYKGKRYITCRSGDIMGVSKTGEAVNLRLVKPD